MAAGSAVEYHSNDSAYQQSDREEMQRDKSRGKERVKESSEPGFGFFGRERGQSERSPGIMADLCAFSRWCPL